MSNGDDACTTNLAATDLIGLSLMSEAAFLSMIAEVLVLGIILWRVLKHWRRPSWKLIQTPIDLYVLSLIISGLVHSVGTAITVRWIQRQQVSCSALCTAQGALELIGSAGDAMSTIAIAVHTFLKIGFRFKLPYNWIPKMIVGIIWLYILLFAGVGADIHHRSSQNGQDDFFPPTPYWCWVGSQFSKERLAGEYFWLWAGGLSSILLYVPLYFFAGAGFSIDSRARSEEDGSGAVPGRILLYPITFTILVLPLSITRWATLRGGSEPPSVIFFAITLYQLSGFVNVLLLFYTRGRINLLSDDDDDYEVADETEMGLGGKVIPESDSDSVGQIRSRRALPEPMEVNGAVLPD